MRQYSPNFSTVDFPLDRGVPSASLIIRLQLTRDAYGAPIFINSGGRSVARNAEVGGKKDSSHLLKEDGTFDATDIKCESSQERFKLLPILIKHFPRVGIYKTHCHADCDEAKPQEVLWVG